MKIVITNLGTIAVLAFVLLGIFGCKSPELLNQMAREKPVVVDVALNSPSDIIVVTGMKDSVFLKNLWKKYPQLNLTEIKKTVSDERRAKDIQIANTKKYVERFKVIWKRAQGVVHYEIRVHNQPITTDNWALALPVKHTVDTVIGDMITATIPLTKSTVYSGKCINCGECVKACPFDAISTRNGKSVVDPNKCLGCGECWTSCKYDALDGLMLGNSYFFAVRATDGKGAVSPLLSATKSPYLIRYTTVASIPDSVKKTLTGNYKWPNQTKLGCFGNCNIKYTPNGECVTGICYIVNPVKENYFDGSKKGVCPVDAIYTINDSLNAIKENTTVGAIFIDKQKCVNCGNCLAQCVFDNGYGSVITETLESWDKMR